MCLWHLSLLKLTKANIFEDIYFNRERNDFDLSTSSDGDSRECLIHWETYIKIKTKRLWSGFIFITQWFFSLPAVHKLSWMLLLLLLPLWWTRIVCVCVCNLYHPKFFSPLARSLVCCSGIKWPYEFLCVRIHISNWWRSWGCWTWFDMVSLGL